MAGYRMDRVNEALAKELSALLPTVKDYRVKQAMITVTGVDCTKDLKQAKVYFSAMSKKISPKEVTAGLQSASGFLRAGLATRLNLRATPQLLFFYDDSMEYSAHILSILNEVKEDLTDKEDGENGNDAE